MLFLYFNSEILHNKIYIKIRQLFEKKNTQKLVRKLISKYHGKPYPTLVGYFGQVAVFLKKCK